MIVRYIFIAFIILFANVNLLNAQSNFKEGYIVTNDNDSITGLIDFRTDKMNSAVCRFKENKQAETQVFYPGDIAKYRFFSEGKYYVSHEVNIGDESRMVFLEYLVQGMMDLYYYKDTKTDLDYYFFVNTDGRMIPVTKKRDEMVDTKIKSDEKYKGVLNYLFNDYPSMTKHLDRMPFGHKSMVGLAKEYHTLTCSPGEQCIDFENDYRKLFIDVKFSVYTGVQFLNYSFGEGSMNSFNSMNSLYPLVGGQMNLSSPRTSRSISLVVDASFSGIKGKTEYADGNGWYEKFSFDALILNGKLGLRYTYPSGKLRPRIEAAMSYCNLFNSSSAYYKETRYNGYLITDAKNDHVLPKSSLIGYSFGAGLDYSIRENQFVFFHVSYDGYKNDHDKMRAVQFKIGYTF